MISNIFTAFKGFWFIISLNDLLDEYLSRFNVCYFVCYSFFYLLVYFAEKWFVGLVFRLMTFSQIFALNVFSSLSDLHTFMVAWLFDLAIFLFCSSSWFSLFSTTALPLFSIFLEDFVTIYSYFKAFSWVLFFKASILCSMMLGLELDLFFLNNSLRIWVYFDWRFFISLV